MPMPDDGSGLAGRTVFVSGAGGFIGAAVVRALVSHGAGVRALAGAPGQVTFELPAEVEPVFADIQDQDTLTRLAAGAAIAIHLAGPPSVAGSFQAPLEYGRVHTGGTLAMLEACRSARICRFVYLSSAEVYGCSEAEAVTEDDPLRPRSPYGASKAAAEQFVDAYAGMFGMESVVLRPFSVYGPRMPPHSVTATILRQAMSEDEIVLGDLASVRDYCYIDDVVEGVLRAAGVPGLVHGKFNLGTGVGTSVGELACLAMRLAGRELPVRSDPSRCRPAHIDIRRLVADRTAAAGQLGWRPRVPFADGLRETLEWVGEQP
jgi:nucleoside-diphosphate-sugar epimerase